MKRLWQVIDREMRDAELTAGQMAEKLGLDPAHLSRLRTGRLRDLSAESLANVLAGLGPSEKLRSEVLAAYLSDKLEGSGATASESVVENVLREQPPAYGTTAAPRVGEACVRAGLNRRVAAAIEALADEAQANRRLQNLLISLADLATKK